MSSIILKRGNLDRLASGHPWVYANEIEKTMGQPQGGDLVDLRDHASRFLGRGYFNAKSQIIIRRLTRDHEEIDAAFFRRRLHASAAVRRSQSCRRLVFSEADFLPGLIVDQYGETLVLQILTLGMEARKETIVKLLREIFQPAALLERSDVPTRKLEGIEPTKGILWLGPKSEIQDPKATTWPAEIEINNLKFSVDLLGGQKTGFFLDQQENYQIIQKLVSDKQLKRVLDCFSYQGGFASHAAKAGAHVIGVEMSEAALAVARTNAQRNGISDRCEWIAANVFDSLSAATKTRKPVPTSAPGNEIPVAAPQSSLSPLRPPFDLIILDPPTFTRNRETLDSALRGYKEIHLRALKLLKPGGYLATFCCSHHVTGELFKRVAVDAAADAHRDLRLIQTLTQAHDHPILPAVPETEYLKGFIYQVV